MITKNIDEDNRLWDDFRQGNDKAYGLIYEKYSKKLYLYGSQFTPDGHLIEDCIHDMFVRIYKNKAKLKPLNTKLQLYLFVSLRNHIITALNKQEVLIAIDGKDGHNQTMIQNENAEDYLINKEKEISQNTLLAQALHNLPLRQREIIHHRFYENMNMDEICVLMSLNYQSAQNLIQRSLKKINSFLKNNRE